VYRCSLAASSYLAWRLVPVIAQPYHLLRDLTRRVSPEDVASCEEKYNKSKMVHSILRHVAETTQAKLEDLYEYMAWPLYTKYGHAFEAFKHMVWPFH